MRTRIDPSGDSLGAEPIKILLQSMIPPRQDDWHIGRFGLLHGYLASLQDANGPPLAVVEARDRALPGQPDPVLFRLDESDFDELWLFAVDTGDGLSESSFHHFADYNWDINAGASSFVTDKPGSKLAQFPKALQDTSQYVRNLALWVAGRIVLG